MILGVSKWLSPKINIEAKYIRIGFVLAVFFAGFGLGLYLILWIVKLLTTQAL
ncbi:MULTISPECIES: PspC domain-containing protein [unclassified Polaribacter]|uniref:PspC domain-containing protein n=1 Tax=unclassified Polaribacter TaxID=196858 RepID=UPI0011BF3706|nr:MULTISPECIES: PspC domain-containing protein [unclassified Polaribacter]TXD52782.1 PspC domain-containing protein [Polaribacter sp. IC063]TXD61659.1 PspC domain-containing protein [Polaribacter sp. IC066]